MVDWRVLPSRLRLLRRTIRFRMALWFAATLAAVLMAFSIFVYARQARDLNNQMHYRLSTKARQLENYLKYNAQEYFSKNRLLSPGTGEDQKYWLQENEILALVDLEGSLVQKIGPIGEADLEEVASIGIQQGIYQNRFSYSLVEASAEGKLIREKYMFVVIPISATRKPVGSLILGGPIDPSQQMRRLLFTLILGNLAMLGIALAGGYWLADRAIRPVQRITRTAQEIGATDLSRRINLGTQDELGELADTFDRMLDRLQAAFDQQRQFTADASHELRTPLTIINLETNRALAVRRTAHEYERALNVIRSENELMTRLVNNLLALSRMDAGQTKLSFEILDFSDVALEVVERLTPLAEQRGVKLLTDQLPELRTTGDRQYLSLMISNLIENAIKYSNQANPRVLVETAREVSHLPDPPVWAIIKVQDNGPGISPEHLSKIFDRFYQVDRARSHNPETAESPVSPGQTLTGSGLGLSIVQWIARAHGGEVDVHSQVGRGSLFMVRIPLAGISSNGESMDFEHQEET